MIQINFTFLSILNAYYLNQLETFSLWTAFYPQLLHH